jgi:hypothetical protein
MGTTVTNQNRLRFEVLEAVKMSIVFFILVGRSEGRRPLGRLRRRWEDNIKMDLREIGFGGCGLDSLGSG